MPEAIAPVVAHGAPSALKRGAKIVAGSRSAMKGGLPESLHYLALTPFGVLGPQRRSLKLAHRANKSQSEFSAAFERHLPQRFDLLGMQAAFDEHSETLVAFSVTRELDSQVAQLPVVHVAR